MLHSVPPAGLTRRALLERRSRPGAWSLEYLRVGLGPERPVEGARTDQAAERIQAQ